MRPVRCITWGSRWVQEGRGGRARGVGKGAGRGFVAVVLSLLTGLALGLPECSMQTATGDRDEVRACGNEFDDRSLSGEAVQRAFRSRSPNANSDSDASARGRELVANFRALQQTCRTHCVP